MSELMDTWLPFFPDVSTLTAGLMSVFCRETSGVRPVTILDRQPAIHASTFPSEIVTCRLSDGSEQRLLCKYAAGRSHNAHGHRGGVAYEIAVYRHVLQSSDASVPTFYGAYTDATTNESWLIIEYLEQCVRVTKTRDPEAMTLAARWIGQFHATNETRLARKPVPFLNTYDAEYYRGWVRRTSGFARQWHERFPWLATLCERSEGFIAPLLASPQTVIHGEYYPGNILFRGGTIFPVDWESAAVAAGEIDLASLTERWPAEIVRQWEIEYQRTRWPKWPPVDFARTLAAARLYLLFRWLGDRPDWSAHESSLWRYEHLRSAGEQLGLI